MTSYVDLVDMIMQSTRYKNMSHPCQVASGHGQVCIMHQARVDIGNSQPAGWLADQCDRMSEDWWRGTED